MCLVREDADQFVAIDEAAVLSTSIRVWCKLRLFRPRRLVANFPIHFAQPSNVLCTGRQRGILGLSRGERDDRLPLALPEARRTVDGDYIPGGRSPCMLITAPVSVNGRKEQGSSGPLQS